MKSIKSILYYTILYVHAAAYRNWKQEILYYHYTYLQPLVRPAQSVCVSLQHQKEVLGLRISTKQYTLSSTDTVASSKVYNVALATRLFSLGFWKGWTPHGLECGEYGEQITGRIRKTESIQLTDQKSLERLQKLSAHWNFTYGTANSKLGNSNIVILYEEIIV